MGQDRCTVGFRAMLAVALGFAACVDAQERDFRLVHRDAMVVDTHNDVVQRILNGEDISGRTFHGHSDLPRFRAGGVDVELFSIWVPPEKRSRSYLHQADEQIDSVMSLVSRNSDSVVLATGSAGVAEAVRSGKFVAMLGMEGGHPLQNDLRNLDHFYRRGVRYMTLTWNNSTGWATSAQDEAGLPSGSPRKGLTSLGKSIVRRMNTLGMIIDISHVGEQTFRDVLKTTRKPVIASHSSVWTLCHHRRNLTDAQLKALAKNGGVVFINFAPWFIDSTFASKEARMLDRNKARIDSLRSTLGGDEFIRDMFVAEFLKQEYEPIRPPLSLLIDHIDYAVKLIGADHVGIGSDFDGITVTPREMDDVTFLPNITRELQRRGYSGNDIGKILGGNFLRVLREVETPPK